MKSSKGPRRYWALFAEPKTYDIEAVLREKETDLWQSKGKNLKQGDGILFWKGAGGSGQRGLVALGEVLEDPSIQDDVPSAHWKGGETEPQPRVPVSYEVPEGLPLWLDEHPWLSPFMRQPVRTVSRANAGLKCAPAE